MNAEECKLQREVNCAHFILLTNNFRVRTGSQDRSGPHNESISDRYLGPTLRAQPSSPAGHVCSYTWSNKWQWQQPAMRQVNAGQCKCPDPRSPKFYVTENM